MIWFLDLKVNHITRLPAEKINPPNNPVLKLDAASSDAFIGPLNRWLPIRSRDSLKVKNPLYRSNEETLIGLINPLINPVRNPNVSTIRMKRIRENVDSMVFHATKVVRNAISAPEINPEAATNDPNSKGRCSGS